MIDASTYIHIIRKSYHNDGYNQMAYARRRLTCNGLSPDSVFTPVTEHPMIRPCLRTPLYHEGPIRFIFTSEKPALVNHSMYSSSVGKSIHTSAKNLDSQNVG